MSYISESTLILMFDPNGIDAFKKLLCLSLKETCFYLYDCIGKTGWSTHRGVMKPISDNHISAPASSIIIYYFCHYEAYTNITVQGNTSDT